MRKDLYDITFVLDRSGSMGWMEKETEGAWKLFVEEQQKNKVGEVILSLIVFDGRVETVFTGKNINDVSSNIREYVPNLSRGSTALFDAMGVAIEETGKRLSNTPEQDRPGTVSIVTYTDGEENSSKTTNIVSLKEMMDHQRNVYSWDFVFLAKDLSTAKQGTALGVDLHRSAVGNTFDAVSAYSVSTSRARTKGISGADYATMSLSNDSSEEPSR